MALNPDLIRSALGSQARRPVAVDRAVAEFGGGTRGRSALAQAMAGTKNKKSKAYKTAMRNLQRYAAAEGRQQRTPKKTISRITRVVEQQREKEAAAKIKGPVRVIWHDPVVLVSEDERDRPDIEVKLSDADLDEFREHVASGDNQAAVNTLAKVTLEAWGVPDAEILSADGLVILQSR